MRRRFKSQPQKPKQAPRQRPKKRQRPSKLVEAIEESGGHGWIATVGHPSQVQEILTDGWLRGFAEPRVAMVGRSNVGKSSLINALMQERKLARVSNTPGKTRTLNFYRWPDQGMILVDLPGYGFAQAHARERHRWEEMIQTYLKSDPRLAGVLVLLDARHGPTPVDLEAIRFLSSAGVTATFVFTKSDELKTQQDRQRRRREADEALRNLGAEGEGVLWISAKEGQGLHELRHALTALAALKR
jgi:GTP-binding protein